jgi:hypothetical protein
MKFWLPLDSVFTASAAESSEAHRLGLPTGLYARYMIQSLILHVMRGTPASRRVASLQVGGSASRSFRLVSGCIEEGSMALGKKVPSEKRKDQMHTSSPEESASAQPSGPAGRGY